MHKSIPLLEDLTPSSEDTIDSCTQLSPPHRPPPGQTKQHFIISYSEMPTIISPPDAWAAPGHHVLFLRTEAGKREGGWRTGAKSSAQTRVGTCHSCRVGGPCWGLSQSQGQRSENSSGEQQILNVQKRARAYEGHVWYLSVNYKPFHSQAAFFPSKSLTAVILTFKESSYFVLSDRHY